MIPLLSVQFPTTRMYSLQEKGKLVPSLPPPGKQAELDQLCTDT